MRRCPPLTARPEAILIVLMLLTGAACEGGLQSSQSMPGAEPAPSPAHDATATPGLPAGPSPTEPALALERQSVRLLPFEVRLRKLSQVTGLAIEDPAFSGLLAARYELGDYNHAQGIRPELSWDGAKMAGWVRGLKPVCAHPAMRERYPSLPEHLNELALAAYGREVDERDLSTIEALLTEPSVAALDEATRYQTICLAMLSAMEFIAQ